MLIKLTESDSQILECFPVLAQLRPDLKQETFLEQVQRQKQGGYQLSFLERDGHSPILLTKALPTLRNSIMLEQSCLIPDRHFVSEFIS